MVAVAIVLFSLVVLMLVPWPPWLRMLLAGLYLTGVLLGARFARRLARVAWIEWRADGSWFLGISDRSASIEAGLGDFRVFGPLIRLDLRVDARRRTVTLWPDSAHADELRRLRIRLLREGNATMRSPAGDGVR